MKPETVQNSFVDRLSSLRKKLKERFPKMDVQNLCKDMGRLAHYHYDKKKFFIMGDAKLLYNYLIENSYNPYTVYRWLLLERVPEDIRFQIKEHKISQKKAISKAFERRNEDDSTLSISIKEIGRNLIRRM